MPGRGRRQFESSQPSQTVRSPLCDFRVYKNCRHSGGLGWCSLLAGIDLLTGKVHALVILPRAVAADRDRQGDPKKNGGGRRRPTLTDTCGAHAHTRRLRGMLKSWPELRIRNPAAQARIVSDGRLWPGRRELSRLFKYMACGRISEFESSHPSQAVFSAVSFPGV
jgi:hypothetical protein